MKNWNNKKQELTLFVRLLINWYQIKKSSLFDYRFEQNKEPFQLIAARVLFKINTDFLSTRKYVSKKKNGFRILSYLKFSKKCFL